MQIAGNPLTNWFVSPATAYTLPGNNFGNVGRNSVVGPGFSNVDLALFKNTKITERVSVQIRTDAFDLFNHPNYGQPARVFGNANFGTISGTRSPTGDSGSSRQLQLALKLIF